MIDIHQAIFGEGRDQGHALLKSSSEISQIASQISGSTDVIDRPFNGTLSSPIIRGFLVKDHYLFVKSFSDPEGRPGRVFSHALILKAEDYLKIIDISELRSFFLNEINKDFSPQLIRYDNNPLLLQNIPTPKERFATAGMISHLNHQNVIAWLNEEEYWGWIKRIWKNLPKQLRNKIQIGHAFHYKYYTGENLYLLIIPEELNSTWVKRQYCIVDNQKSKTSVSNLENYILGFPENTENIIRILKDFDPKIREIDDLKLFSQFADLYANIDDSPNYRDLLRFIAIVSQFNPDLKSAVEAKTKILNALSKAIKNTTPNEFHFLQGQSWVGFDLKEIDGLIKSSVTDWLDKHFFDDRTTEMAVKILISNKTNVLYIAIKDYVRISFQKWKEGYAANIWRWIEVNPQIIPTVFPLLPNQAEKDLIATLPNLSSNSGDLIIDFAEQKKWILLFGSTIIKLYQPTKAFLKIFAVKSFKIDQNTLAIIAEPVGDKDLVLSACQIDDPRLSALAIDLIKKKPSLKDSQDAQKLSWQNIWLKSINEGLGVWEGIKDPKQRLYQIMDLILKGKIFINDLLNEIAESAMGTLKDYPNRAQIWDLLPEICKPKFITSTLIDYLSDIENQTFGIKDLEKPLLDGLESSELRSLVIRNTKIPTEIKLNLIQYLGSFSEDEASVLIQNSHFNKTESKKLSVIISQNGWRKLVSSILSQRNQRPDLEPIIRDCAHLLGFWERLFLTTKGYDPEIISVDEFWTTLLQKAVDLYPEGPNQHGLWERSGGNKSDLHITGSAKHIWQNAISHIKNGGNPEAKNLLKCMIEDFHHDDSLKQLIQII